MSITQQLHCGWRDSPAGPELLTFAMRDGLLQAYFSWGVGHGPAVRAGVNHIFQ